MSEQLTIFDAIRAARSTDPGTSHAAAAKAAPIAKAHGQLLLDTLKREGPAGKSRLARLTGLTDVAVARRLPELQRQGKAAPNGQMEASRSGRDERVWAAV